MSRTSFAALLKKYQSGDATTEERRMVEQWYELIEEQPAQLTDDQWAAVEVRLWHKLQRQSGGLSEVQETQVISLWKRGYARVAVAACVVLMLTLGYRMYQKTPETSALIRHTADKGMELVVNNSSSVLPVALEDGSRILLNPKGELRYPTHFAALKREVYLSGEAFFEISENPNRPFLVNAGDITTRVLGTSFRIKAPRAGSDVEVAVRTGKVAVYEKQQAGVAKSTRNGSGVILNPNHQVTFMAKDKMFITRLVENPVAVLHPKVSGYESFNYDDTPLKDVIAQLENAYSIDLELERKTLGDCPLTADLSQKGLYAQLGLICAAIEGTYEVKGTSILISGKGCE